MFLFVCASDQEPLRHLHVSDRNSLSLPENDSAPGATVVGFARIRQMASTGVAFTVLSGPAALRHLASVYASGGTRAVARLDGEFGAVLWDARSRSLVALRDPLGLAPLYYKCVGTTLYVSDAADAFPESSPTDREFIAEFIATGGTSLARTIWSGVFVVPPGGAVTWRDGRSRVDTYWEPASIAQRRHADARETTDEFRRVFTQSVLADIDSDRRTWADLSGGLDSSSVVSSAAVFGQETGQALGGTFTFTDSLGGDETKFVDAVLRRFGLRNERVSQPWPWRDDGEPPPITQLPTRDYVYYARDRATGAILTGAGATSLLSGIGPDCYMPLGARHAVDMMSSGAVRTGFDQLFSWAYITRRSIWQSLARDVLLPIMPVSFQQRRHMRRRPIPTWLSAPFVQDTAFKAHWSDMEVTRGWPGVMSQTFIPGYMARIIAGLQGWRNLPGIGVRHPMLDRRLVELCMALPAGMRSDVTKHKPLLRSAMEGVVPKEVLARQCTKGSCLGPRICWAFRRERPSLAALLKSSVLADLGCIEPKHVLADLDAHASGGGQNEASLYTTLSLETWLSSRASRYVPQAVG